MESPYIQAYVALRKTFQGEINNNNNNNNNKKEPVAGPGLKQATSLSLPPHGRADPRAVGGRHTR
jgi:hypothetical protein